MINRTRFSSLVLTASLLTAFAGCALEGGDVEERELQEVLDDRFLGECPNAFVPGDADGDGELSYMDVNYISWMYQGYLPAKYVCLEAADANGDCRYEPAWYLSDWITLARHLADLPGYEPQACEPLDECCDGPWAGGGNCELDEVVECACDASEYCCDGGDWDIYCSATAFENGCMRCSTDTQVGQWFEGQ